jgi:hypothetical protein
MFAIDEQVVTSVIDDDLTERRIACVVVAPVGSEHYELRETADGQHHVVHRELIERAPKAVTP